ncbi:hypothetical protein K8I28_10370 [bacterium]|nr:hypothetical protein [bacterium]
MGLIESRSQMEKKSAIKNIVTTMVIDGVVDENEKALLWKICDRLNVSRLELNRVFTNPGSIKDTQSVNRKERAHLVLDLILMMLADGRIDKREMDYCKVVAAKFDFESNRVPVLVDRVLDALKRFKNQNEMDEYLEEIAEQLLI